MEWKYIKTLKDNNSITDIERKYKIKIPNYLKDLIIKYNGGRPEKIYLTQKRIRKEYLNVYYLITKKIGKIYTYMMIYLK